MAGYYGCLTRQAAAPPYNTLKVRAPTSSITGITSRPWFWDFSWPVEGFLGSGISGQFSNAPSAPIGTSDVLFVRVPEGREDRVQSHSSATADIVVSQNTEIQAGDVVLVSDCRGSAVVQIQNVTGSNPKNLVTSTNIGESYPTGNHHADVQRVASVAYYVANSAVTAGQRALWRWDGFDAAQEMATGVEQLWVHFGVDTNTVAGVDSYVASPSAPGSSSPPSTPTGLNWGNVRTVRFVLLVASPDVVIDGTDQRTAAQQATVAALGRLGLTAPTGVTLNDGRLRQVVAGTVALRNVAL
jgi:type IV pilus assembly protein PilW